MLTKEKLEDLTKSPTETEDSANESDDFDSTALSLEKFTMGFLTDRPLEEQTLDYQPMQEPSIQVTHDVMQALESIQNWFLDLKRQKVLLHTRQRLKKFNCNVNVIFLTSITSSAPHYYVSDSKDEMR